MAGCAVKHFRVVVAAADAFLDHAFKGHGMHATTMGASHLVIVTYLGRIDRLEELCIEYGHFVGAFLWARAFRSAFRSTFEEQRRTVLGEW